MNFNGGPFLSALAVFMLSGAPVLRAESSDPLREIFYVPFEDSIDATIARGEAKSLSGHVDGYETGKVGKAARSIQRYNGLRWDGRGNIDLNRGTLALFFKPEWDVDVDEWLPFAGVWTDIEGYWSSVFNFIIREEKLQLQMLDVSRYTR